MVPFTYGGRCRCKRVHSDRNIPATAQRTHATGAAIAMAVPMMTAGTERQRVPSMAMAVPAATTASPTQSGLTFHFVFFM